jgi:hypothetical protein
VSYTIYEERVQSIQSEVKAHTSGFLVSTHYSAETVQLTVVNRTHLARDGHQSLSVDTSFLNYSICETLTTNMATTFIYHVRLTSKTRLSVICSNPTALAASA